MEREAALSVCRGGLTSGSGRLDFAQYRDRTILRTISAASPLQFLNPRNHGHGAWVYTSSHGGGMVGGDSVHIQANVSAGATALLSTQASSKIFRSSQSCKFELDASVDGDGLLAIIPDPLVCFADSHFTQRQSITLSGNANLILLDWLSAGRQASGERWAFRHFSNRIEIDRDGERVMQESMLLDPAQGPLDLRMGRFNILALAIVAGPNLIVHATALQKQFAALPINRHATLVQSASPLRDSGVILRMAGTWVEPVVKTMRQHLSFLTTLLGDDPWARKW